VLTLRNTCSANHRVMFPIFATATNAQDFLPQPLMSIVQCDKELVELVEA
jgi:hypothetical protein